MSKFKVGDTLRNLNNNLVDTVDSICDDAYYSLSVGYIGDDTSLNVELWSPKENEWCWFNMEIEGVWQSPVLMKYGEQDVDMWSIEPFIGNLPSFIQD